jgi:hypothetical protein
MNAQVPFSDLRTTCARGAEAELCRFCADGGFPSRGKPSAHLRSRGEIQTAQVEENLLRAGCGWGRGEMEEKTK